MRDFIGLNSNVILSKDDDDKWRPIAEVIIITSEPQYHLDEDLDIKKRRRDCEQFRFIASEKALTGLIGALERARFELQSQMAAANFANEEKKAA